MRDAASKEKPLFSQASISQTSSGSISPLRAKQRTTRMRTCSVMSATASGAAYPDGTDRRL
jgi:hypothetical protein